MTDTGPTRVGLLLVTALSLVTSMLVVRAPPTGASTSNALVGTFKLSAGSCHAKTDSITGSYFRVLFPAGSLSKGPYFKNANSTCSNKSYTLVRPGTEGGLETGTFQPDPSPIFGRKGNAKANAIIRPVSFTGIDLALSTNPTDRQTKRRVPRPAIVDQSGTLTGNLEALSSDWNKIFVNQGSPKPGGRLTGLTSAITGTYDASTRSFVLSWTSQIESGRFSQFVWVWHLEGTFIPSLRRPTPTTTPPPPPRSSTTTTTAVHRAAGLARHVGVFTCRRVAGGWAAGGVATNASHGPTTYHIVVNFVSAGGRVLASGSTTLALSAGEQSNLWNASARFSPPAGPVHCEVARVSGGSSGGSATSVPTSSSTTTQPPSNLARQVGIFTCHSVAGGWSAGGVATNASGGAATYHIVVNFESGAGRVLATGSTTVALAAGEQSNLWNASATFSAPPGPVSCAVASVSAG